MPVEIERKFLVKHKDLPPLENGIPIVQGYLSTDKNNVVRVRLKGLKGILTIKGKVDNLVRSEFEYPIPARDAREILKNLCIQPLISKNRYEVKYEGLIWEIDVFHGANEGLILAEVELEKADQTVKLPPWVKEEVSGDFRYSNSNLVINPYQSWPENQKETPNEDDDL